MEKWLCWIAMAVTGFMLVVFGADLFLQFPFQRTSATIDVLGIIACGVVGYLSWDALRDLR